MADALITQEIIRFLSKKEFINVATSDFQGRPNVAPKLLLKVEEDFMYLVDYVIGRTYRNIKTNPKVSISTVNLDTLIGYQMNGGAAIIDKGPEYKQLIRQYREKKIDLSVARVIDGVQRGKGHATLEEGFSEKVVIFKVKIEEIVEIIPSGQLKRKKSS